MANPGPNKFDEMKENVEKETEEVVAAIKANIKNYNPWRLLQTNPWYIWEDRRETV